MSRASTPPHSSLVRDYGRLPILLAPVGLVVGFCGARPFDDGGGGVVVCAGGLANLVASSVGGADSRLPCAVFGVLDWVGQDWDGIVLFRNMLYLFILHVIICSKLFIVFVYSLVFGLFGHFWRASLLLLVRIMPQNVLTQTARFLPNFHSRKLFVALALRGRASLERGELLLVLVT